MLLTEQLSYGQAQCVVEREEHPDGKNLYMKGIFIQGGVRNFNQRVYPVHEIHAAVEAMNKQAKETNGILGECDHPEELTINLDRVSHIITEMWMEGSNGMGKLKIVDTPMGKIVRTLIESGVHLGVSSRGVGNVDDRGEVSGFEIVTIDIVCRPSAPQAFPKPVYESLQDKRGRSLKELAEAVVHDPKAQKHFHKEMLHLIDTLRA
jgi:hypothetical protein